MYRLLAGLASCLLAFTTAVNAMVVPNAVSVSPAASYACTLATPLMDSANSDLTEVCRNNPIDNVDPLGLKVLINGVEYSFDSFANDFAEHAYNKLIVRQMIDAEETFAFGSLPQFKRAVKFRFHVLEAAALMKERGVRFGGHNGFEGNAKYWRVTEGEGDLAPTALGMQQWGKAIESLFSSETLVDCGGAVTIAYLYAQYKTSGEIAAAPTVGAAMVSHLSPRERELWLEERARQGHGVQLTAGPSQEKYSVWWNRIYARDGSEHPNSQIAGDWLYVPNGPLYDPTMGDWAGEHAIFVESKQDGRFLWGHGVGYTLEADLRVDLADALNGQLRSRRIFEKGPFKGSDLPVTIKMYDALP